MADIGHEKTDDIIDELEKKIRKEYEQANKEVQQKVDKYFARFKAKDAKKQAEVLAGTLSQKDYEEWRYGQMCVGERWKDLKDQLAKDYVNVNNIARSTAEGYAPEVYALNHNFAAYQVQHDAKMDISWTLYNREAVEYLMRDDPQLLPFLGTHSPTAEKLRERMDLLWNRQHINSAITQGILQGEPIPRIAKRLERVTDMNKSAAVRNARTMMTSAENKGRQDAYDRLKEKGIDLQEMWMATLDGRTRHSHRALHGTYKDPKSGEYANGLRYPGDPMGEPEEIYNCRCCEIAEVEGVKVGAPNYLPEMENMSFDEWLKGGSGHPTWMYPEESETNTASVVHAVAQGVDISSTWERRADQFQFEIEDVMNAQGFDGLPRVVSAEEFDEYVKQANGGNGFIAQRTYSAPDAETLNKYRDELYNGKWYVDCSVGHSSFGQGMYCTPEFATKMDERGLQEQKIYGELSRSRIEENAKNQYLFDHYKSTLDNVIRENNITDSSIIDILKAYDPVQGAYHDNEWYVTKNVDWVKEFASLHPEKYKTAKAIIDNNEDELEKAYRVAMKESKFYKPPKAISNTETFTLMSDAKIANYSKLVEEMADTEYTDIGVFATAKGYDAVNIDILDGTIEAKQTLILNRTKCIFKGE